MKRWLQILLQLFGLLIFVALVYWAGPQAWQAILQSQWQPLLIAFLLQGAAGVCSGTRLRTMSNGLEQRNVASWRRFFRANWGARALGLVLPRTLSSLGGKSVALRHFGMATTRSVWAVMTDNLLDLFLFGLFCLPGFYYLQGGETAVFLIMIGLILLGTVTAVYYGASPPIFNRVIGLLQKLPWVGRKFTPADNGRLFPPPIPAAQSMGLTIALTLALVTGYYFMAQAVSVPIAWPLLLASFPFVQLSLIAAITPGGIGIFDLGWIGLLILGGVPRADALTFTLAQRAYVTIFVLIWTGFSFLLTFSENNPTKNKQATSNPS